MKFLSLAACALLAAPAALAQPACPDLSTALDLPPFPTVEQGDWNNFGSRIVSSGDPFHMVHDEVVRIGGDVTMRAKFDYGALFHVDLVEEEVATFLAGPGIDGWQSLGSFTTDDDGIIYVPVTPEEAGDYAFYAVVVGDLTSALGYILVLEDAPIDAVLFDIDATLTTSDFEAVNDYLGLRDAQAHTAAVDTVNAYLDLNYRVFFLTNRPYWQGVDTREWFSDTQDLPPYIIRFNLDFLGDDPVGHKSSFINEIQAEGINIIRVYGNADTDIEAYELAGIPKEETYIIGELAGEMDTQAITGDGYFDHFLEVVVNTPPANCIDNDEEINQAAQVGEGDDNALNMAGSSPRAASPMGFVCAALALGFAGLSL